MAPHRTHPLFILVVIIGFLAPTLSCDSQRARAQTVLNGLAENDVADIGATVFNLDRSAEQQNSTGIAVDPTNPLRIVGTYDDYRRHGGDPFFDNLSGWSISTNGSTVAKEGLLGPVDLNGDGVADALSRGHAVVAADRVGNFFVTSTYNQSQFDDFAIIVARSPAAGAPRGLFSTACSGGADRDCWPLIKVLASDQCTDVSGSELKAPWIAVDRSSSVASGAVYVVWTEDSCGTLSRPPSILLIKCNNTLTTCTAPVVLESVSSDCGSARSIHSGHVTVGPTGKVYVTWAKSRASRPDCFSSPDAQSEQDHLRLMVINPSASWTSVGTLGPLRKIVTEFQPLVGRPYGPHGVAGGVSSTSPTVAVHGARAIVVWAKRQGPLLVDSDDQATFADSNIVATVTDNDGATFSALQTVSSARGPQYEPQVCTDNATGKFVVAYYSHQDDRFRSRQDLYVASSATGLAPYSQARLTRFSNESALHADFVAPLPQNLDATCVDGAVYVHFAANYVEKLTAIAGSTATLKVHQRDNFLTKAWVP